MSSPSLVSLATASFSNCPQQTERREEQKEARLIFKKEARKKKGREAEERAKELHIGKRSLNKIKGVGFGLAAPSRAPPPPPSSSSSSALLVEPSKKQEKIQNKKEYI